MIDREAITAYERDGVVCVRSVVDPATVQQLLNASNALMDQGPREFDPSKSLVHLGDMESVADEPGRFFGGVFMSQEEPVFRDFALHSALPETAAALMQSDVARFFYDQLFMKDPGTISPTTWHNDMPFWPLTGSDLISCWVALTPVTIEESGLEYVAGSHRWNKWYQATMDLLRDETMEEAPDFGKPENREGQRIVGWDMQPGDVLFHHPLVVHGASGNRSQTKRRVGLSVRYIGNDAQWAPRMKAMPLPRPPAVEPGSYPADDAAFPIAWRAAA